MLRGIKGRTLTTHADGSFLGHPNTKIEMLAHDGTVTCSVFKLFGGFGIPGKNFMWMLCRYL